MPAAVSVVIPCYRCAGTVGRAVRSAIDQSTPPGEIILVDDASGDGTREALATLQREHGAGRVRIIEQPENRGPASARNAGWHAARGTVVAFLDADDLWHARKLEVQLRFMREHPEFALTGHLHMLGAARQARAPEPPAEPRFAEVGMRSLLFGRRFATTTVLLRRDLAMRFADGERYAEDYLLWLQLASTGHRLARIEVPLATRLEPMFGGTGLSGHLWPMEKAELRVYRRLQRDGMIGPGTFGVMAAWSLAKYARRLVLVGMRGTRPA
jgi:glycosyltransferase involved in cell wall biosynthesis